MVKIIKPKPPIENISGLLDRLCEKVDCGVNPTARSHVTVEEFLDVFGRRAYGPLLLAVGLFAISPATIVPGMTWLSAALTLLIAAQMTFGADRLWLPKAARERKVSRDGLLAMVRHARPWAKRIDVLLKPRFSFLAHQPWLILIGLLTMASALVTFPLGFIPAAPLLPGLAIVLFGLGMTAKDGLVLTLGIAMTLGAAALAYRVFG